MAIRSEAVVALPTDTQILITREFDAPRDLVWEAYTKPEHIRRWWAGQRGEVTSIEVDLRVGGGWRYVMIAASNGLEVAFHGEYREIVPNERIVSTEVYEGTPDAEALDTVTLTEVDGRTTMTILVEHSDREGRDAHVSSGMEDGLQEAMDLLEETATSLG
jgi:uncharacterized protein YndB with AHSA1/START domain